MIASTIANANRGKTSRPIRPHDFFPDLATASVSDPSVMRSTFLAIARAAQRRAS